MLKHVSLDQLCIFICIHFEKPINVKNNFIKWNQITLKSIMTKQKNEDKSMIDCLNILVNELRHLQHDLSLELQNETFMQNHLITECEEVSTCQLTCYKHSFTLTNQIIDLHTVINAYEKSHKSKTENFFTDQRYHRGSDRKFQFRQSSFRVFIFYQSRSRPLNRRKKRCFVCSKKGC